MFLQNAQVKILLLLSEAADLLRFPDWSFAQLLHHCPDETCERVDHIHDLNAMYSTTGSSSLGFIGDDDFCVVVQCMPQQETEYTAEILWAEIRNV